MFVGAVFGAVAGNLAAFRLPGERIEWVISGTAFGALTVLAAWAAALLMSGNRVGTRVATTIGLVLIAWSAADLATHGHTSPGSQLARSRSSRSRPTPRPSPAPSARSVS